METLFVAVSVLAAAANLFSAGCDFVRYPRVLEQMSKVGVPHALMPVLGVLKAAGAAGLLAGLVVPWLGTAAAAGLIAFFTAAIGTHLRARDFAVGLPAGFLTLAAATLALGLTAE